MGISESLVQNQAKKLFLCFCGLSLTYHGAVYSLLNNMALFKNKPIPTVVQTLTKPGDPPYNPRLTLLMLESSLSRAGR